MSYVLISSLSWWKKETNYLENLIHHSYRSFIRTTKYKQPTVLFYVKEKGWAETLAQLEVIEKRWNGLILLIAKETFYPIYHLVGRNLVYYVAKNIEEAYFVADLFRTGIHPHGKSDLFLKSFRLLLEKETEALTQREQELLSLLLTYKKNQEIADQMGVEIQTIANYKKKLSDKLVNWEIETGAVCLYEVAKTTQLLKKLNQGS